MILVIRNKQILYEIDRYEIVDVEGEKDLIKCYPNKSDIFFYIGEDDRLSFDFIKDPVLPADYREEDSDNQKRFIYEYDKSLVEFKKKV